MVKIGNLKIDGKLVLAPIAGYSHFPFRKLCLKYGSSLVFTEMINCNAISRGNKATFRLAYTEKSEKPVGLQLFGTKEEVINKAVNKIGSNFDLIDFNFGCPALNIVSQGAGSALLKRPAKIKSIIETLVSFGKPVSAKIRISPNFEKVISAIEKGGASAITIHGRSAKDSYAVNADWNYIRKAKCELNIPVIGNGDVKDEVSALKMINETRCDLVMIGRAAMGNPLLFSEINYYLKNFEEKSYGFDKRKKVLKEYVSLCEKNLEIVRFSDVKSHVIKFISGFEGAKDLRRKLIKSKNMDSLKKIISLAD